MTFGEAAATHLRNLDDNLSIKPRTRDYWRECLAALQKSWPGLNETEVRKITQTDCREWARAYRKTVSPTRYNSTVSVLRHVLNVAVEAGVVYSNAAATVKRAPVRGKEIALPTIEQFNTLLEEMRNGHGRDSRNCADFAAGLAFTGMRKGEANALEWRDVDFDAGEIAVHGDATTGTKNWELPRVPLIPDARMLRLTIPNRGNLRLMPRNRGQRLEPTHEPPPENHQLPADAVPSRYKTEPLR